MISSTSLPSLRATPSTSSSPDLPTVTQDIPPRLPPCHTELCSATEPLHSCCCFSRERSGSCCSSLAWAQESGTPAPLGEKVSALHMQWWRVPRNLHYKVPKLEHGSVQKMHENWCSPCCLRRQQLNTLSWSPPTPTAPTKMTAPGPVSKLSMFQAAHLISFRNPLNRDLRVLPSADYCTSSSQPAGWRFIQG